MLKYENLKTPRHTKFVAYSSTRCLWLLLTFMLAIIKWSVTFFHVWNLGPRSKHLLTLVKPIHSALVKVLYIQLWDCLIDYSCKDCKTSIQCNSYALLGTNFLPVEIQVYVLNKVWVWYCNSLSVPHCWHFPSSSRTLPVQCQ